MVGILTFHKAINYGAVLQAYALRSAVETLNFDCGVINYAGKKMLAESKTLYFPKNSAFKDRLVQVYRLPMRISLVRKFNRFLDEYLNLSGEIISSKSELEAISKKFDKIITGSDQVFNYNGTGEDFNFYLEFLNDLNKKIAYAPSFGLSEIDSAHKERVRNCLKQFKMLSVRESIGADIVEELIDKKPTRVCDPTFLLSRSQWKDLCVDVKVNKPYVLVYSFGSRHLEGVASKLADEMGGIVVNINRSLPSFSVKIKNAYAPSPREFLGLINNASLVVTNSFHGMALSVLLGKDFYGFRNSYSNSEATNNRFNFFSEDLGLADRIFDNTSFTKLPPINYNEIDKKVLEWRMVGTEYLRQSLGAND